MAVQLLPAVSQQFQSNEVHIIFEEGVRQKWDVNHNRGATLEPALDQLEEGMQPRATSEELAGDRS